MTFWWQSNEGDWKQAFCNIKRASLSWDSSPVVVIGGIRRAFRSQVKVIWLKWCRLVHLICIYVSDLTVKDIDTAPSLDKSCRM